MNSGTIESGEGLGQGGVAVVFGQPGVLTNTGTIVAAQGASHHGFDYTRGCDGGVAIEAAGGALSNTGTIAGGSGGYGQHAGYGGVGIILSNSGMLTNQGLILGGEGGGGGQDRPGVGGIGLDMGPGGSASNDGMIAGGAGGAGRYSGSAGTGGDGVNMLRGVLDNVSVIAGGNGGFGYSVGGTGGVGVDVSGGTLKNTGSISGGAGGAAGQDAYVVGRGGNGGAGVYLNGGVLMDAGTISGGAAGIGPGGNGVAGDAVLFGTLAGELVLQAHAVLDGAVAADPTVDDVLILAGKSAASIAAPVTGFTNVDERANARWTVTGELQAATITLAGGILIDSASGTIVAGTRTNAEAGTILVSQGGTLVGPGTIGAPQVIDDGKLDAHGGTLTVKGSLSGYGTVRIDSNATLVEKGTLSVTHVAFGLNGDAHLVVAQPIPQSQATPTFYAFGAGDTIALQHLQANSLDFANGTLSLQDAGVTVDTLLFSGDYSSANFTLTSDGNGGTVLSYVPDESHMPHFAFLQHW